MIDGFARSVSFCLLALSVLLVFLFDRHVLLLLLLLSLLLGRPPAGTVNCNHKHWRSLTLLLPLMLLLPLSLLLGRPPGRS